MLTKMFCLLSLIPITIANLHSAAFCDMNFATKEWYQYSLKYIQNDQIIMQNSLKNLTEFQEHLELRENITNKITDSKSPTDLQLTKLLVSPDSDDKRVALVYILIRKTYNKEIYAKIVKLLRSENDYLTRFYCYNCINLLSKNLLNDFSNHYLDVVEEEENESLLMTTMPSLEKIDSSRIVNLFVKNFKRGSKTLKRSIYVTLRNMDNKYYYQVKEILEKENAWMTGSELSEEENREDRTEKRGHPLTLDNFD